MSRSRSQKQDGQTSQPSTSPPPEKPTSRIRQLDPVLLVVGAMTPESIGRAVGQAYYDLALREPSVVVGTAVEIGRRLKALMLTPDHNKWSPVWEPVVERYMSESLIAPNPQASAVAICRLAATYDYCLGSA